MAIVHCLALFALVFVAMNPFHDARGAIVFEGPVESVILRTQRFVRVYLPPSYATNSARKYPVLYVHDGQNAFTTAGPGAAFGWGGWDLDRIVDELVAAHRMRDIILVAIDCSRERYQDYRGPVAGGANARYENYARFLMEELKPKMDRDYRTLAGAAHTGLLGSSMGGICSLAMAWEHPEVFGLAASLSGAFQVERRAFLEQHLKAHHGVTKPIRVYLDSGVCDFTGGDDGRQDTDAVAGALLDAGWKRGMNLLHFVDDKPLDDVALEMSGLRRDKWAEAKRSQHNEF